MTLPEGVHSSPPPSTPKNRLSTCSTTDEDNMFYDDLLMPQTQVSTPETQHSWPLIEEPFTTWSTQDSFAPITSVTVAPSSMDFAKFPQVQTLTHVTAPAQWANWTTTSMEPSTMNLGAVSYAQSYTVTQAQQYGSYGAMQGMIAHRTPPSTQGHGSSFYIRAPPTSSPRMPNYQETDPLGRYLNGPVYRY